MTKLLSLVFLICSFAPRSAQAQELPPSVLDHYVNYTVKEGRVLEKSILPNMKRAHPNQMLQSMPCYPGKKIMVVALMAEKPSDFLFKITINGQVIKPGHEIRELTYNATSYWLLGTSLNFTNVTSNSEYCMELVAYDGNKIDLPVYIYFFSFK